MGSRFDPRTASWVTWDDAKRRPGTEQSVATITPQPETDKRARPTFNGGVPSQRFTRDYRAALDGRFTLGWHSGKNSADALLAGSLSKIRGRSRSLVRDNPYAKRAKQITVNNVIGSGIGMQADVRLPRGNLITRTNDAIEEAWEYWTYADQCHTGGSLCFQDLERLVVGEMFETGEAFVRLHFQRFGNSDVPLGLEYIEPERLAEEYDVPQPGQQRARMGIEVDAFGRPVAYYIHTRHPGEVKQNLEQLNKLERVDASLILHLYVCTRWPQHRGEPWLHATARRLYDMDAYVEAEITAARASAAYMGFIKTPASNVPHETVEGQQQINLEPGIIERLGPEEDFISHNPNRPNAQLDPFMRYMLREVAAGTGGSYESISRDYSQSNYSSTKLSRLDDTDNWKHLQQLYIRAFRRPLHDLWMQQAVAAGAIAGLSAQTYFAESRRYNAAKFKPRGWSWVDPTKEVEAYKEAIRAGFTTVSRVISQTADGLDLEDVLNERRRELDLMKEMDLKFDTEFEEPPAKPAETPPPEPADEPKNEPPARLVSFVRP